MCESRLRSWYEMTAGLLFRLFQLTFDRVLFLVSMSQALKFVVIPPFAFFQKHERFRDDRGYPSILHFCPENLVTLSGLNDRFSFSRASSAGKAAG